MDIKGQNSPVAVGDLRSHIVIHAAVGHVHQICRKKFSVVLCNPGQAWTSALFFPVQKEFNMKGHILKKLQERPDCHHMSHELALVVCCPAPVKDSGNHGRRKGIGLPEFQRLRRLYVIMTIKQDGRRILPLGANLCIYRRFRGRRKDFCLQSQTAEQVHQQAAAVLHANILRTDAGLSSHPL